MEPECRARCDVLRMALLRDLTAEDLLSFHQCLCQEPISLQQVQGALSKVYSKMNGVYNPETLLDSLLEQERKQDQLEQMLWNVQMLNSWSRDRLSLPDLLDPFCNVNENHKSVETWQHHWSHQMMGNLKVWKERRDGKFEVESLKAELEYLSNMEQERHRVSTRWAVGGVAAVIHDDGQDMECLGPVGKDIISKSHLLQVVEQKYQVLIERLHHERLHKHWEISTSLSMLLNLHRCCEQEMSSILSTPMVPMQRFQLFLSQYYLQSQAHHQDTFETAALVLGITEWKKSVQAPEFYESLNEILAVSRLQDFICTTPDQKPRQLPVTTFDPKALEMLGKINIQKMILEQLCKNHHDEQSLLLQFIYKQMMSVDDVEPCTEKLAFSEAPIKARNDDWVNPPSSRPGDPMDDENGYLQLELLEKAFVLYWIRKDITAQPRSRSPAIMGLMELQLMQLARVQELIQQMEGQSMNDLVSTYCSLHDDLWKNRHYNNLTAMFLGLDTPEMDTDQIGQGLGSAAVSVHDRMDDGVVLDICKIKPVAVRNDITTSSEITVPILDNFPLSQRAGTPQEVKQMDDVQMLQTEEDPASSDTIKTTRVTGGTIEGFSALQPTGTQSQRNNSQVHNSPGLSSRDPISVAQHGEQVLKISVGHPASQSRQEEIGLDNQLDQVSMKAMYKGKQNLTQEQQQGGEEPDSKFRDPPRISGPRREMNMVLISDEEKKNVLRSLAHVQRRAEEKRRRDKERQTLRVQEGLSIARNRTFAINRPFPQTHGQDVHTETSHKESVHWRTRVRETLEQLRQERTFILRSKGERNTASFKELFDPMEAKNFNDGKNWSERSKEVRSPEIHVTDSHNPLG